MSDKEEELETLWIDQIGKDIEKRGKTGKKYKKILGG